jgi:tRNA (cytosine38-C5)-methyltransferase
VLEHLTRLQYHSVEFLLTPKQYGIPNSRLRYYLIARRSPFRSDIPEGILQSIPGQDNIQTLNPISDYLESNGGTIPDRVLQRWGRLFDIVHPSSTNSCCFTRGMINIALTFYTQLTVLEAILTWSKVLDPSCK